MESAAILELGRVGAQLLQRADLKRDHRAHLLIVGLELAEKGQEEDPRGAAQGVREEESTARPGAQHATELPQGQPERRALRQRRGRRGRRGG